MWPVSKYSCSMRSKASSGRRVPWAGEAPVDAADGEPAVAEPLGAPAPVLDAQVGAVDVLLADRGQPRERGDDLRALVGREAVALAQGGAVRTRRELLGLG